MIYATLIENPLGIQGDWLAWAQPDRPVQILPGETAARVPSVSVAITSSDPQQALERACRRIIQHRGR